MIGEALVDFLDQHKKVEIRCQDKKQPYYMRFSPVRDRWSCGAKYGRSNRIVQEVSTSIGIAHFLLLTSTSVLAAVNYPIHSQQNPALNPTTLRFSQPDLLIEPRAGSPPTGFEGLLALASELRTLQRNPSESQPKSCISQCLLERPLNPLLTQERLGPRLYGGNSSNSLHS